MYTGTVSNHLVVAHWTWIFLSLDCSLLSPSQPAVAGEIPTFEVLEAAERMSVVEHSSTSVTSTLAVTAATDMLALTNADASQYEVIPMLLSTIYLSVFTFGSNKVVGSGKRDQISGSVFPFRSGTLTSLLGIATACALVAIWGGEIGYLSATAFIRMHARLSRSGQRSLGRRRLLLHDINKVQNKLLRS